MDYGKEGLRINKELKGKIGVVSKVQIDNDVDLSIAYTPGVADTCKCIVEDKSVVYDYTGKGNFVAIVSDGSAVLGLGDIGPEAALPVMEGKCALFKELGGVNAIPLCLNTKEVNEIVTFVKHLSPTFGGINLEDISAPRCFEIENRLKQELDIPVFHDDQHGTAVCVLAGLLNGLKVIGKEIEKIKVVVNGGGAAGIAISKILLGAGVSNLLVVDKNGILCTENPASMLNWAHQEIAEQTNPEKKQGNLADALVGADVFIGVSRPGLVTKDMVKSMNKDAIVFAMANPVPEIFPEEALDAGARIVGTGRSDYQNQINNVLVFPGVFRGALDVMATDINREMNIAAAYALAEIINEEELGEDNIIPKALDLRVGPRVAAAVAQAAIKSGVARKSVTYAEVIANANKLMK